MNFKDFDEFYPTPPKMMAEMVSRIDNLFDKDNRILEPSAGSGNIALFLSIAKKYPYHVRMSHRFARNKAEQEENVNHDKVVYDNRENIQKDVFFTECVEVFEKYNQTDMCNEDGHFIHFTGGIKKRDIEENKKEIFCIEKNPMLRSTLTDNGFNVIDDDFLSFNPEEYYSHIIMNPPFSNGDEHLLHAICLMNRWGFGGQIICLLNAETIKNPYSNKRKLLCQLIDKYNGEVEYFDNAFSDSERKTDVEIALVNIRIPERKSVSSVLDELENKEIKLDEMSENATDIVTNDYMMQAVLMYKKEIEAGKYLFNAYYSLAPYLKSDFDEKSNGYSIRLDTGKNNDGSRKSKWNEFVYTVRHKYWYELLHNPVFLGNLTSNVREEYYRNINEFAKKDFSLKNIRSVKMEILKVTAQGIEDKIVSMFEQLSYSHSMECEGNIHMFTGWKTNKAFYINKKIIAPISCFDNIFSKFKYSTYDGIGNFIDDLEKCLNFMDGEQEVNTQETFDKLKEYEENQITKNLDFKYFTINAYKKGTIHVTFKDDEILKKFNIYGCMKKGWLPPVYGKKSYKNMTDEEKAVIDEFEGESSYMEIYNNPDKFIVAPEKRLMLS